MYILLIHSPHSKTHRLFSTFVTINNATMSMHLCLCQTFQFPSLLVRGKCIFFTFLSSIQFSSVCQSCPTLCSPMNHSTPGLPVHHQLPESVKLMSIESVMSSSHLILCRPLLLLPPIPPSIRVFSNESTLRMRWPKDWSFSFSISPSNEHPGPISFRMDWLDLQKNCTKKIFTTQIITMVWPLT